MPLTYAKKEKKTRYGLDIYIATSDGFISIIVVVGGVLSKPTKTVPRYEQNCWHEAFAVVLLCKLIRFLHFIGITLNKKESLKLKGSYIYCLSIQAIVQKEKKKKKNKIWDVGAPGHKALAQFGPLVQEIFDGNLCLETSQSNMYKEQSKYY